MYVCVCVCDDDLNLMCVERLKDTNDSRNSTDSIRLVSHSCVHSYRLVCSYQQLGRIGMTFLYVDNRKKSPAFSRPCPEGA